MTCPEHEEEHEVSTEYTVVEDEGGNVRISYYFHGYCDEKSIASVIDMITWWDAEYPDSAWDFTINSEGGEMSHGTALYSVLARHSIRKGGTHHITTRVAGMAASCGALIFQAGDERVGGEMDFLMIHEPMCSFEDEPLSSLKKKLKHADMWVDRFNKVCLERSSLKLGEFMESYRGVDWWIPMNDAVFYGLADRIEDVPRNP